MNKIDSVLIHSDPLLSDILQSQLPPNKWHQRSLYLSASGCEAWLAADAQVPYTRAPSYFHRLRQASMRTSAPTFISLGPGGGQIDQEVVTTLRRTSEVVTYIPLDINVELLRRAIDSLSGIAVIPFGILADFEASLTFLNEAVQRTKSVVRPVLIGLLGGTFGNIDLLESNFLTKVASITQSGDFLMFDAIVLGSNSRSTSGDTQEARYFLASGAARQTGRLPEEVLANFGRMRIVSGSSDVPRAVVAQVVYEDPDKGPVPVLQLCEYPLESLREWASRIDEFELIEEELIRPPDGGSGFGVVLLRRR